ncbi:MAG: hypothetical protein KJ899_15445 [Gammaproteobacteria bacterium]|nr:hypothetical protein [Gammaproteobacteria bacterium]
MKSCDEMVKELIEWFEDGVGNVTIFRAPRAQHVDCVYEETIKLFELDREIRGLVEAVFEVFDADKMEFFRNGNGDPDRVRITRRG